MSIATDEAESKFGDTESWMNRDPERNDYIDGRTAEPTEAEIEAAARVFFGNLHYPSASLDWDKAADSVKDNWRLKTRLALTAARKAVTA